MKHEDEAMGDHDEGNHPSHTDHGNNNKPRTAMQGESGGVVLKREVDEIVDATLVSPGCVLDVDGDIVQDLRARQHANRKSKNKTTHHGNSSLSNSSKSRNLHWTLSATARSSTNANTGGGGERGLHKDNSSSSMAESGTNVSFGGGSSQDATSSDDTVHNNGNGNNNSNNSSHTNSQVGMRAKSVRSRSQIHTSTLPARCVQWIRSFW